MSPEREREARSAQPSGVPSEALSSLEPLIDSGIAFLQGLKSAAEGRTPEQNLPFGVRTETDERTGRDYLKVPMPEAEQMQQVLGAVGPLLQGVVEKLSQGRDDE